MSERVPVDQDQRDLVRDQHATSIFVEAGAGTGKTSAIVDRVVSMVAAGWLELRELAAITFTEAAAAELRDRIRGALDDAANGRDARVTSPESMLRCAAALHQLDEAALTTLHGFAQRILAEHPLEAGLPPGFEVMDPIRARVELEQRWAAFVDEVFADATIEVALVRGLALGLSPELLYPIAVALHENHDRLPDPVPVKPLPALSAAPVLHALDRLFAHRRGDCNHDDDLLARRIDGLVEFRDHLAAATDELDLLDVLAAAPTAKAKVGKAQNWKDVKAVQAAALAVDTAVHTTRSEQRLAVFETLLGRLITFVQASTAWRRAAGTLEFHDLLVFARDLLRDDADVRAAVAARFKCILLDEFQDTDPLQIEIAVLLTTDDPDAGTRPWTDVAIRPGALGVVGDPKQSIYRFRRADLRVYHQAKAWLGLEQRSLVENFRSVPGVIDFVNHLFSGVLEEDPGVQAAHVELHAHRAAVGHDAAVAVFGAEAEENVGEIRLVEADDVASVVRSIKAEGWLVTDPETGLERPARYHDVALLIPSRTVLPALEDALERAGVPVRVESQSLVFSTAEVRDLLAALSAIDDPTDEIAIVATLRSPGFGCSDAELVDYVTAGGRWDYRRVAPPDGLTADHPVVAGLAALRDLWEQRWWRSVSETVEAIVRERRLLELALSRRRPRDHWRRIRYLLDQARAWDDAGDASLRAFVAWVQQQADERARVMESVAPEPDDDALRILTVHGAKGLEFPIVVLAGLNVAPPNVVRAVVWGAEHPEFGVGTKGAGTWVETDGYTSANKEEEAHEAAERLRLLYVAMTRARDHLVISLHRKARQNCHAAQVAERLTDEPFTGLVELRPGRPPAAARPRRGSEPASADMTARERWLHERATMLEHAQRPSSISATAIAKDGGPPKEEVGGVDVPPWRRGRAGTAIGRAVHAVLQTVGLADGAGLAETARAQALAEEVPDREADIRTLVESVLAAPTVRAATAAGSRCWREVPVGARIDGVLVEGFIDLLIEDGDGFTVVDYKTDQVPSDDDLAAALARYTPQGAAYALALEAVLGRPVSRCVFVFARSGGAVEVAVSDLPEAVAKVRDGLGRAQPEPAR